MWDIITNTLLDLKKAQESLASLRERFASEPQVLQFYEPGAKYLVESLRQRLYDQIQEALGGSYPSADFWVKIEGASIDYGRIPIGVLAAFLKQLNTANKHAVSLLENVKYVGGRFNSKINELTDFRIAGFAPGSFQIGFEGPNPHISKQINLFLANEEEIFEIIETSQKAFEGISLLFLALQASENEDAYNQLLDKVTDKKNVLKLLYYAKQLTPALKTGVEKISFYGDRIRISENPIVVDKETRFKLQEVSRRLVNESEYVEGEGFVREVDLDKRSIILRPVQIGNKVIDSMNGKLVVDFDDWLLQQFLGRAVSIAGFMVYSEKEDLRRIDIEDIDLVNQEE